MQSQQTEIDRDYNDKETKIAEHAKNKKLKRYYEGTAAKELERVIKK